MADARLHWSAIWSALADSFTVAAPDLPGFGDSARLRRAYFSDLAGWVERLCDVLGFARAAVAGNSFGATIARLYAATHQDRVSHLVLLDGGGFVRLGALARAMLRIPMIKSLVAPRQAISIDRLQLMFADPARLTPDFIAACQADGGMIYRIMRDALIPPLPANRYPRVKTLVLWGDSDRQAPPERGRAIAADLPNAEFRLIENAGHLPQLEQPAAIIDAIRSFVLDGG